MLLATVETGATVTLRELSSAAGISERDIAQHLEHLARSLKNEGYTVDKAKNDGADAVIDTVYLSLISRKTTPEEHALLKPIADNADSTNRGDVLWTMLNTRQFFFIQ